MLRPSIARPGSHRESVRRVLCARAPELCTCTTDRLQSGRRDHDKATLGDVARPGRLAAGRSPHRATWLRGRRGGSDYEAGRGSNPAIPPDARPSIQRRPPATSAAGAGTAVRPLRGRASRRYQEQGGPDRPPSVITASATSSMTSGADLVDTPRTRADHADRASQPDWSQSTQGHAAVPAPGGLVATHHSRPTRQ